MMSPVPRDDDFSAQYPERFLKGEYLKDEGKFLGKVSKLVEKVSLNLQPSRMQYEMEFLPQEDGVYAYPEMLRDRLMTRTLESVKLTIVSETLDNVDAERSFITTTLEFEDGDGTLYVSRDGDIPEPSAGDVVIGLDGLPTPVGRMSDAEIEAFVLSLGGLYHEAALQTEAKEDTVVDASKIFAQLEKHAVKTNPFFEYALPSGRVIRFDSLRATTDRLMHFSIRYETGSNNGSITARVDRDNGLKISFTKSEYGETAELIPNGGDYIRLIEILNEEIKALVRIERNTRLTERVLATASLDNTIERVLDEDGFDTPNTSA